MAYQPFGRTLFPLLLIIAVGAWPLGCDAQAQPRTAADGVGENGREADAASVTRHYDLPADAGVLNVKQPPFNAKGDGVTDDTATIQAAIASVFEGGRYATPRMIYFPEGTYLVSGPLASKAQEHGWSGGWRAGMILLGESRDGSIIKLKDKAEGYGDAGQSRPVIITGSESDKRTKPGDKPLSGGGNRAFRHSVLNLTVDVGSGNPGATGIDYIAHNRGTIEAVTIRSSDPERAGHTGLKMTRNWPGPCYMKDVLIEGFDRGIDIAHYEYGNTFEDITLRHQREAGIVNQQNMIAIHRLTSDNAVPVLRAEDENGLNIIVEGTFTGGDSDVAAVMGKGELYLRDINVKGYGTAVDSSRSGGKDVDAPDGETSIDFYSTEQFAMGVDKAEPMRLPIRDTPTFWTTDHEQWVSPQQMLPEGQSKPGEGEDWTAAVQAAMDAGKPIVYLPNGSYKVSKTISVPPHVRTIIGFQSAITPGKDNEANVDPLLRFVDTAPGLPGGAGGGSQSTTVEHVWISGHVEHAASRAVAFRHCDIHGRYRNTKEGTGDMFIEDTIGPKPVLVEHPQNVFARQLNIEFGEEPLIENHGGTLWLLGYKTEGEMVCIKQTAGRTELLGGLLYPLRKVEGGTPALLVEGGRMAASLAMSGPKYPIVVRSLVKGGEQTLTGEAVGWRAVALVEVHAGSDVEAAGGKVEREVINTDGGVPFWKAAAADDAGVYKDEAGDRWTVMAIGGTNDFDKPANWKPLTWNGDAQRWEGPTGMADQAPSYAKTRTLRGRPSGGKLVGLVFTPAKPGTYALTGEAKADTWGPDGPIRVVVNIAASDDTVRELLKLTVDDGGQIAWDKHAALRSIELDAGDRLVITFASEKGGTASFDLAPSDKPTSIRPTP